MPVLTSFAPFRLGARTSTLNRTICIHARWRKKQIDNGRDRIFTISMKPPDDIKNNQIKMKRIIIRNINREIVVTLHGQPGSNRASFHHRNHECSKSSKPNMQAEANKGVQAVKTSLPSICSSNG